MKKIYFLFLIVLFPILLQAQDVYEIKFTAGITQYRGALILWQDGIGKMRVKYYSNGQTKLIQQDMNIEDTQYGMRLTGYNAVNASTNTAASYNPDNFYISQDENGNLTCTNVDDAGVAAKATIRMITGYVTKQNFLKDFNWKL